MNAPKNILIIGNGFDLDLGWRTSYKEFERKDVVSFWPRVNERCYSALQQHLDRICVQYWFDLENELREYAKVDSTFITNQDTVEQDRLYFEILRCQLMKYISFAQSSLTVNKESIAARLLREKHFDVIYNFNYTDIYHSASLVGAPLPKNNVHVHGCVKEQSIILGVDGTSLRPGYEFLHKNNSIYYCETNIKNDLLNADKVVFFGHSFGQTDYHYFKDFFTAICNNDFHQKKKHITIYTYNENSSQEIISRLMNNGITLEKLRNNSEFEIICTSKIEEEFPPKHFQKNFTFMYQGQPIADIEEKFEIEIENDDKRSCKS